MNELSEKLDRKVWAAALAAFACHFLIMTAYYVLKSARSAIFLATFGAEWNWIFLILNAVVSFAASVVFGWLADLVSKRHLITGIQGFFVANLVGFWLLFRFVPFDGGATTATYLVSAAFPLWVGFFVLFTVTPFWSVVNDVFRPEQGKRLYGFIGAGATVGTLCGGEVARLLAKPLGTVNLLPVSAAFLALTVPLFLVLLESTREGGRVNCDLGQRMAGQRRDALAGLKLVFRDPYVGRIAALVLLSTLAMTVVDNQMLYAVDAAKLAPDGRTAFYGSLFSTMSVTSLVVNLVVTPLVLTLAGLRAALLLLPLSLILGACGTLRGLALSSFFWVYAVVFAVHYSVNQVSKELLYVPCGDDVKYKAKAFIDTFGYRAGAAGCGLVWQVGRVAHVAAASFSWLTLAAVAAWVPIIWTVERSIQEARGARTKS